MATTLRGASTSGISVRSPAVVPRPAANSARPSRSSYSCTSGPSRRRLSVSASRGGGLLDSDTIVAPGKSTEGARKKPPIYNVMLHNDSYNRREYVVKVLLKTIDGMTVDKAVVVMQEAHESGVALVVACAQDVAESYVETLRLNGLISTLEPGH